MTIPRGWILPVTPGTQLVTVVGAIANDVHGKNHHVLGSFGDHVQSLTLIRTDGDIIRCAPQQQPDWFAATVGGLELTGVITHAEIQLRRVAGSWLDTETVPYTNFNEFFQLADDSEADWEHTVFWIDCIAGGGGRGLFMRGNPTATVGDRVAPQRRKLTMLVVPSRFLGSSNVIAFIQYGLLLPQEVASQAGCNALRAFFLPVGQPARMELDVRPQGLLPIPERGSTRS